MRLYVEPMDTVVVEVSPDGRLRYEGQEELSEPTLQERRAVIYAARNEMAALAELIEVLDPPSSPAQGASRSSARNPA
jgi:hypothetical protein